MSQRSSREPEGGAGERGDEEASGQVIANSFTLSSEPYRADNGNLENMKPSHTTCLPVPSLPRLLAHPFSGSRLTAAEE